jgi:hypothetical protein
LDWIHNFAFPTFEQDIDWHLGKERNLIPL